MEKFKDAIWRFVKKYRKYALLFCDFLIWNISFYASFAINRNSLSMVDFDAKFLTYMGMVNVCFLVVFLAFRLYDKIWRYADAEDFFNVGLATFCAVLLFYLVTILFGMKMSMRMNFIFLVTSLIAILMFRVVYRLNKLLESISTEDFNNRKRMLIVGGGDSTALLLREISKHSEEYLPVAIVDDDSEKIGRKMMGVKVAGSVDQIPELCEKLKVEVIVFAIVSIPTERRRQILDICAKTNVEVRIIPNIYDAITSGISIESAIRKVRVEDLLGREAVVFDKSKYGGYLSGKTIMVTGGGGSIGSELCRQIATLSPKKLIILDIYENTAYEIEQELKMKYGKNLNLSVEIATICDKKELEDIFSKEQINVVFHAAAHKHVPLMENNPEEAVKNNIYGTLNLIECADKYKIEKFVQISTDKAVNPTNIMGATKRVCEMLVQAKNRNASNTEFVAVRFGNVLGSHGSVIPLFEEQIKNMGPITVTHPDIIRYFMTIPEAVSLVMTAGGLAHGGEIFVLDMGDPVKIKDLAENLIRLSGFTPGEDIKIEYTGLRPGEKLFEELLMDEEGIQKTKNKKIYIGHPIEINEEEFYKDLEELRDICDNGTNSDIENMLLKIVPTFRRLKD